MPCFSGVLASFVQFERVMNQLHGAGRIFLPGHDGQIQLRGALGDHHDVDVGGSQNSEGPGGNSGNSFDAFADKRDDRDIGNAGNAIDTPAVDFGMPASSAAWRPILGAPCAQLPR